MNAPLPPNREPLPPKWPHLKLHERVRDALAAMPSHFAPDVRITGLSTPSLHTLNTPLGATIEEQAALTLNAMRSTWDPQREYATYSFVRQPQTFPDVRLTCSSLFRRGLCGECLGRPSGFHARLLRVEDRSR